MEKFVTIKPSYVRLSGEIGQAISVPVTIIPEKKYRFKILEVNLSNEKDFRCDLIEKHFPEGDGYQLMVENIKVAKGRYNGTITLKTDSGVQPVIKLRVYGRVNAPKATPESSNGSNLKND